ncbi:MAG: site-specific integrase [Verrucomicrobiota bacterium]
MESKRKGEVGSRIGTKAKVSRWKGHKLYRWRVSYMEGGRYRQKGFKTQKLAEEWAEKREEESAEFGNATSLSIAERSIVIDNREKLEKLGLTLQGAIEFAIDYHERAARSSTVRELFDDVIFTRTKAGLSDGHLNGLKTRLDRFAEKHGELAVATIEKKQVEHWLHGLAQDYSPRTVNHHRTALVSAFNDAIEGGHIERNPAEKVKTMKVVESETEILTPSQLRDLLEGASEEILPAFAIGAFAGIRDSEIKKLDWNDVDFKNGVIHVRGINAKSAKNRRVEMPANLRAIIQPISAESGSVWPKNGRKLHDQAKLDAGFANPESLTKKQLSKRDDWRKWPTNGLRHSYASYHLAHHKDAAALALNLGHRDTSLIFAHYRALVTEGEAEEFWSIGLPKRAK